MKPWFWISLKKKRRDCACHYNFYSDIYFIRCSVKTESIVVLHCAIVIGAMETAWVIDALFCSEVWANENTTWFALALKAKQIIYMNN